MKKMLAILMLGALLLGCNKQPEEPQPTPQPETPVATLEERLPGDWELVSIDGVSPAGLSVWIRFSDKKGFDLWQRSDPTAQFAHFWGTWTLDGDALSGTYVDGTPWAAAYTVSLEDDRLELAAGGETSVFRRGTVGADVTDHCYTQ